jgi:dimethylaniline monooxygenase (N-oxide forming)
MVGKRVLIIGIGNSAVDIAINLVNEGNCPRVSISTRSGVWIIPNYINGFATDLYACRVFLALPWKLGTFIMESVIKFIYGDPKKYNLNPKVRALQSQPTVCPTLIHHIQRNDIIVRPNVKNVSGYTVTFEDGHSEEFDCIIESTGYKIDLDFLDQNLRKKIFKDTEETILDLYKHVFHPEVGESLSFIGFVQPTSGGLLTVSEMQARWFTHLILNDTKLPPKSVMVDQINKDQKRILTRFNKSSRHTIQTDPIVYNDEISEFIDAKPSLFANFGIAWRLLFSSCGPDQYRLNGLDKSENATQLVQKVPVTNMMKIFALLCFFVFMILLRSIWYNPITYSALAMSFLFYKKIFAKQAIEQQ